MPLLSVPLGTVLAGVDRIQGGLSTSFRSNAERVRALSNRSSPITSPLSKKSAPSWAATAAKALR